jgi:hypothetical protein
MIQFETNRYSVPTAYVDERVTIRATADQIYIMVKDNVIAHHLRNLDRNQDNIILDHYLDLLLEKHRALSNTKVYNPKSLPQIYEHYRKILVSRSPKGNREFVRILMLHREYPSQNI